jgi:hypothetical protein
MSLGADKRVRPERANERRFIRSRFGKVQGLFDRSVMLYVVPALVH